MTLADSLASARLVVADDQRWTLTVEGVTHEFQHPYDLHTALDLASRYIETRYGVTDVQWADPEGVRAYSGTFIVHSWQKA